MGWTTILAIVLALIGLLAGWLWREFRKPDEVFERRLDEFDLRGFNGRLKSEVASRQRPMDHQALTRTMGRILLETRFTEVPAGMAGSIEPSDEFTRLACEELVKPGRLSYTPDGKAFRIPKA